ncbi:uncharacterized protein [Typha angustifolia]|uniref:uncharacterized protein isoform X2 n=1 Tax=Typha angustifolia TaxID=59011 RepID=UPI003C2C5885
MDEAMEKQPTANSKELFPTGSELKKKRKLKFELSDFNLPLAKHKCVNPLFSSVCKSPIAGSSEYEENSHDEISDTEIRDVLEEQDSDSDSNSYLEVYDTNVGSHLKGTSMESYGPTMILDRPSTSCSSSSNAITNTLNSFQSANTGEVNKREQAEDNCQYDPGHGELHLEFEANNDDIIHAKNGTEHSDEKIEDVMLYSNCPLPNAFPLSSGLWSTRQDARLGARKPTIDQEFEQYFSMLML